MTFCCFNYLLDLLCLWQYWVITITRRFLFSALFSLYLSIFSFSTPQWDCFLSLIYPLSLYLSPSFYPNHLVGFFSRLYILFYLVLSIYLYLFISSKFLSYLYILINQEVYLPILYPLFSPIFSFISLSSILSYLLYLSLSSLYPNQSERFFSLLILSSILSSLYLYASISRYLSYC